MTDEELVNAINDLMLKAVSVQCYDVAMLLRDARNILQTHIQKKINDQWAEHVLNEVFKQGKNK